MNTKFQLRAAIALVWAAAGTAAAAAPLTANANGDSPNRIVGLWSTQAEVRPCGTDLPPMAIVNTLLIHAGGTIVENPRFPPGGAPNAAGHFERTQALGTWQLNRRSGKYWIHLRFDNYIDKAYDGHTTIDREARFRKNGLEFLGPVSVSRFNAEGTLIGQLCGRAVSSRL
jgi:hypothetical protein